MKRFIERMDRGVRELQQKEKQQHQQQGSGSSQEGGGETAAASGKKEKSRWFGKSSTSSKKEKASDEGEELVEGLRVDQYLVVFLKFMSSIGKSFSAFASRY
jgi:ubiquitin-like-conjugating enzyme ATG3